MKKQWQQPVMEELNISNTYLGRGKSKVDFLTTDNTDFDLADKLDPIPGNRWDS